MYTNNLEHIINHNTIYNLHNSVHLLVSIGHKALSVAMTVCSKISI